MTDERTGTGGRPATSAEDAKRFYEQRHGQSAPPGDPGEPVVRTTTSHYGAQSSMAAGGTRSDREQHPDPRYHAFRESQVEAMDRDYDAFRARHTGHPAEAFGTWRKSRESGSDGERSLALGESPNQGSAGPHILDRSFSGTYED